MKKKTLIFSLIIFILLAFFFIVVHPIALLDTDDWTDIHLRRLPIPVIHSWNPIKVFPEIFMSVVSYAGAYLIYPILGKYVFSLSISTGLFICFILTIYFAEFHLLIQAKYHLSAIKNILISILFVCLHFIAVAHIGTDNIFLFYSVDLTCIYHYTLSTTINAALVMHMIRIGGYQCFPAFSKKQKAVVVLWTYFAIFSSLYTNVILAVYIGVQLLVNLSTDCHAHKFKISTYAKANKFLLIVLCVWISSLFIETTGGRSEGKENDYFASLLEAFRNLGTWFKSFNLCFIILMITVFILWIIRVKNKNIETVVKYALSFIFTTLYIVLLSAVVNSEYISRVDVMIATDFWLLLILMLAICRLAESDSPIVLWIMGLLSTISVISTAFVINTYQESNYINLPYEKCEKLADDIIIQFKEAEQNGKTEFDLVVPKFPTDNNWPYGIAQSDAFSKAMYRHGITKQKINVRSMILSEEKYKQFIE